MQSQQSCVAWEEPPRPSYTLKSFIEGNVYWKPLQVSPAPLGSTKSIRGLKAQSCPLGASRRPPHHVCTEALETQAQVTLFTMQRAFCFI